MTATLGGKERELTVEEALQQQTLKDALADKRMAIRKVLKMIEKREAALTKKNPQPKGTAKREVHHCADNANAAMQILGIASPVSDTESARWKVHVWAVQAAQSRPGTRKLHERNVSDVKLFTFDADTLRWPHGRSA